jgi:hypothetical protein
LEKGIEGDGELGVGGIEMDDVIRSPRRDEGTHVFGEIAVRVDQSHGVARDDVLEDHVAQQRCFAGACLADDIDVLASVIGRDTEGDISAPSIAFPDDARLAVYGSRASRHSKRAALPPVSVRRCWRSVGKRCVDDPMG